MITEFKLIFEGKPDIDIRRFQQSLPEDFLVQEREDGIYIVIPSSLPEEERYQYLVDRELDRHFFLTSAKIRAEMVRRTVTSIHTDRWRIHGPLPTGIKPQIWSHSLAMQLRLWAITVDTMDIPVKLLFLFQIIEISYPDTRDTSTYPTYSNSSTAPNPLTECKLIRDLIAHSGVPSSKQLKCYCSYLVFQGFMHDVTDPY